jgi:hypothetical protein
MLTVTIKKEWRVYKQILLKFAVQHLANLVLYIAKFYFPAVQFGIR